MVTGIVRILGPVAVGVLFAFGPMAAIAQDDFDARLAEARKLSELMDTKNIVVKVADDLIIHYRQIFEQRYPGQGDTIGEIFARHMLPAISDLTPSYIELTATAYAERFTLSELEDMTAFYETPTGKRLTEETPGLMADLQRAGLSIAQALSERLVPLITDELSKKNVNPNDS